VVKLRVSCHERPKYTLKYEIHTTYYILSITSLFLVFFYHPWNTV
jgi:hypothetical protein